MTSLSFLLLLVLPYIKKVTSKSIIECNFDVDLCAFNNSGSYLWTRHSGSTPSGNTGPTQDHTGGGYYMYMESSSPNYPSAGPFILQTEVSSGGLGVASFWYNMYGLAIGTLSLDISNNGESWTSLWSKSGDQGQGWRNATVIIDDLSTHFRFYGITGTDYTGDIAVDDINVTSRITPAPSITSSPTTSFIPSPSPSPLPTPIPSTITITTDTQLSNHAVSNATIELASDISLSFTITFTDLHNFIINGNGFEVSPTGLFRCFSITGGSVSINDLTVANGYASAYGGAFIIETSDVVISRCIIKDNTADAAAGGGIYFAHGGFLQIYHTTFRGNAAANGGAIRANGGVGITTIVHLTNTSFFENTASIAAGGAVVVSNGAVMNMEGGVLESNFATGDGGGIACYSGFVTIRDVRITSNTAKSGGGVSCDSSTVLNMTLFTVSKNEALRGGGFFVGGSYTQVRLSQGDISNNLAVGDSGGGVYVASGTLHISECMLKRNFAIGPSFTTTSGSCVAEGGCFFSMNYPSDYGVDEYCEYTAGSNGTLLVTSFNTEQEYDFLHVNGVLYDGRVGPECVEVFEGNVIIWASDQALVSSGFQICYAVTSSGGGMHLVGGDTLIFNCSFIANNATRNGGAINLDGGSAHVSGVSIFDNSASSGDAMYITSGSFDASQLYMEGEIDGVSAESVTCLSPCQAGEYGNCSIADGSSDCYINCECRKCPAGYYSASVGSVSVSDCLSCGAGQVSSEGASVCTSCPLGKYATDDVNDDEGGLISQVSTSATSCNKCPEGYFTDTTSTLVCQACSPGEFSGWGAPSCSECPSGSYSSGGVSNCTECETGFYGETTSLSSCTACAAGSYQPNRGSSACLDCPIGKSQGVTGQSSCDDCAAGSYSDAVGSSVCSNCDSFGSGYSSSSGSAACEECLSGYYRDPEEFVCRQCDSSSSVCPSENGVELPTPTVGFWINTHKLSSFSGGHIDVYRCNRLTCKGTTPESSSCWLPSNVTSCNRDALLCSNGATGPLCGSCGAGYVYSSADRYCITCTQSVARLIFMVSGALMLLITFVIVKVKNIRFKRWERTWLGNLMKHIDSGPGRVLWTNYQIIQSVSWSLDVSLPWPFSKMVGGMSFISFDFLTLKCFESNYLLSVILWSIFPILVVIINFFVYTVRISRLHGLSVWNSFKSSLNHKEISMSRKRQSIDILRQHMSLFILWSYLVVPPVTRKQLEALDCVEVSNKLYVRTETQVSCQTKSYHLFEFGDILFVCIYLSVPLIWLMMLFKQRDKIRAKAESVQQEVDKSMILRNEHKAELAPLRLLFDVYRPSLYFFEALEIYRRILFVGVIPLISIRAARRAAFGLMLGIVSAISFRELEPFVRSATNLLAYVASYTVVLTFGAALVIDTGLNKNLNDALFGFMLVIVNLIVITLAFSLGAKRAITRSRGGWQNRVSAQPHMVPRKRPTHTHTHLGTQAFCIFFHEVLVVRY